MMRRIPAALLPAAVLVLAAASPALAAGGPVQDAGGFLERAVAALIDALALPFRLLGDVLGMNPITEVVWAKEIWTPEQAGWLKAWYTASAAFVGVFFLVSVVAAGLRLSSSRPAQRAEAVNTLWRCVFAVLALAAAPVFMDVVLDLFTLMAEGIAALYQQLQPAFSLPDLTAWDGGLFGGDATLQTGSVIGTAVVKLAFLGFWIYLNIIYLVRKLVLTGLICAFPFLIMAWSVNGNVPALSIWLGEVGSNAVMPVAHALMLCFILGIVDVSKAAEGSWLTALVAIYVFFPFTEMLRNSFQSLFARWAGVNEAGIAGSVLGNVLGVGGLMRVGRAAFAGGKTPVTTPDLASSPSPTSGPGAPPGPGGPTAGAPAPVFAPAWSSGPATALGAGAAGSTAPALYASSGSSPTGGSGYTAGYAEGGGDTVTRRPIGFRPPGQDEPTSTSAPPGRAGAAAPGGEAAGAPGNRSVPAWVHIRERRRQAASSPTGPSDGGISGGSTPPGTPQSTAPDGGARPQQAVSTAQKAWRAAATVAGAGAAVAVGAALGAVPGMSQFARPAARAMWNLGQRAAQYGVVGPHDMYTVGGGFRP